jgi:polysaccharide pyruvyl transferase WcaK-like protein
MSLAGRPPPALVAVMTPGSRARALREAAGRRRVPPFKILLIPSDLAASRGDRAIAEGIMPLLREAFPGAEITTLSERPDRDGPWLGARILPQSIHSLSPLDFVRFLFAVRRADLVLWGGGEILKDYTNKAVALYWAGKMRAASWLATRVVGVFQGIGAATAASSRRAIAIAVRSTDVFIVRDETSYARLVGWGVPESKLRLSFDPAVLPEPTDTKLPQRALAANGLDSEFLESFVAVAPRNWFHYRPSGFLPVRLRRRRSPPGPRNEVFVQRLVALLDDLAERHSHVLVIPMHVVEDRDFCLALRRRMANPEAARVLSEDVLSPGEVRRLIGRARMMVAFRLHAGIVASSMSVPTLTFHYVDKGRAYAEQVGMSRFTWPIETMLEPDAVTVVREAERALLAGSVELEGVGRRLTGMRAHIRRVFLEEVANVTWPSNTPGAGARGCRGGSGRARTPSGGCAPPSGER